MLLLFSFLCQNQSLGCDFENWVLTTLGTLCGVLLSPQETTDIPKFKLSVGHMPSTHRPPSQPLPQGRESGLLSFSLGRDKVSQQFFFPKPQSFPSHSHISSYVSAIPANHLLLIVSLQIYLNILTFVILPPLKFSSSKTTFACVNCIFSNTQESDYIVIGWKWNLHLSHLKWSCLPFVSQGAIVGTLPWELGGRVGFWGRNGLFEAEPWSKAPATLWPWALWFCFPVSQPWTQDSGRTDSEELFSVSDKRVCLRQLSLNN